MSGSRCGGRSGRQVPAILTRTKRKRPAQSPPLADMDDARHRLDASAQFGGDAWSCGGSGDAPDTDEADADIMELDCAGAAQTRLPGWKPRHALRRGETSTPPPALTAWARCREEAACVPPTIRQRVPPLPQLPWIEVEDLWVSMRAKDFCYRRDPEMMRQHPALRPHMRAILIDWLIEVCEVHRLHRETFYLAVDFLDRYLSQSRDLPKSQLQLGGITCLMIASKLEEIYPPKVADFAYVTDGACSSEDIQDKELVVMKVLDWSLSPLTPQHWLGTYLQLTNMEQHRLGEQVSAEEFTSAQFSTLQFVRMCQLLDLIVLDAGCLRFNYGVLAAAAFFQFTRNRELAVRVSGYSWEELSECVCWMGPFFVTLRPHLLSHVPPFDRVAEADRHNIQVHAVNLQILEEAQRCAEESELQRDLSPVPTSPGTSRPDFLTPPDSGRRTRP